MSAFLRISLRERGNDEGAEGPARGASEVGRTGWRIVLCARQNGSSLVPDLPFARTRSPIFNVTDSIREIDGRIWSDILMKRSLPVAVTTGRVFAA